MNETPDPWDEERFVRIPELPDDKGPSACTLACIIVGALITLGFACYGFYRLACAILNLAP